MGCDLGCGWVELSWAWGSVLRRSLRICAGIPPSRHFHSIMLSTRLLQKQFSFFFRLSESLASETETFARRFSFLAFSRSDGSA